MRRKLITSLVSIALLAVGLLSINLALGYRPALGLDLRGGISVTLKPVGTASTASLNLAVERIRERVDSVGVGEPEIVRQQDAIVVNLPGVNDQEKALDLVKVSGKVYLRPVLQCINAPSAATSPSSTVAGSATSTVGSTVAGSTAGGSTVTNSATSVAPPATGSAVTVGTGSPGPSRVVNGAASTDNGSTLSGAATTSAPPPTAPPTTLPASTSDASSTTVASGLSTTVASGSPTTVAGGSSPTAAGAATTTTVPILVSDPTKTEYLRTRGGEVCQVGRSQGTGEVFEKDSARARILGAGWGVTVNLKTGRAGEGVWNALATQCYNASAACPTRRLAIQLDAEIQSAPSVNAPTFTGSVEITGSFTRKQAENLAQVLNSGALPITLQNVAVEQVSATLGKDSLRAAIISGAIGVALVLLFMMLYYRRLALVVIVGLCISGALVYSVTALISRFYNGVLSLSGVAGLIVSIGVTIDSYVVFFERLKDEVRGGRSLRNSAQRGFKSAFRTILVADAVSLIGAAVLWYLSVGAVRGFAFYLGLSTVMDVFVAYFFTRPAVLLLARSRFMSGKHVLGLDSAGDGAARVAGATT